MTTGILEILAKFEVDLPAIEFKYLGWVHDVQYQVPAVDGTEDRRRNKYSNNAAIEPQGCTTTGSTIRSGLDKYGT
jgi:hypothetical protein